MEHGSPPENSFAGQYWRCLYEIKARSFKFAERRLLEKINDLTYGRGQADVAIANRDDLAESVGSNRGTTQPIIEDLISRGILGHEERLGTWWLNDINLWGVPSGHPGDPAREQRAAAAEARIIAHDRLRAQPELFPREISDAEIAAEGEQAHAAGWPVTALPSAVSTPSAVPLPVERRCEIHNANPEKDRVNFTTAVVKLTTPVVKFTTERSYIDAGARPPVRPGNQVKKDKNIPGKPGGEICAEDLPPLDHAGWSLLKDIEAFCVAGGDAPFIDQHRKDWEHRVRMNPLGVEMCYRETLAHVRERRKPFIRTRAGWMKGLWREEEKRMSKAAPAPPPDDEIARRCREELEARFGRKVA